MNEEKRLVTRTKINNLNPHIIFIYFMIFFGTLSVCALFTITLGIWRIVEQMYLGCA